MRAQGKPDASRIRWPRTQERVGVVRALQSPTGVPDIRLSLHDERYGLCLMCPGQPATSPVTTASALRLAVRSDGFINARLGALAPAHFGFAVRSLPRPSCMAAADRFIRDRVCRPRDQTDMPEAVSVHRDPVHASDGWPTPLDDRNDSIYTLDDILRQATIALGAI